MALITHDMLKGLVEVRVEEIKKTDAERALEAKAYDMLGTQFDEITDDYLERTQQKIARLEADHELNDDETIKVSGSVRNSALIAHYRKRIAAKTR